MRSVDTGCSVGSVGSVVADADSSVCDVVSAAERSFVGAGAGSLRASDGATLTLDPDASVGFAVDTSPLLPHPPSTTRAPALNSASSGLGEEIRTL